MKPPPKQMASKLLDASTTILRADDPPTLADIAEHVGIPRATLYYYFSGREDLLAFLLAAHVDEGAAAINAADNRDSAPVDRLRAVLDTALVHLGRRPDVCAGLLGATTAGPYMSVVLAANEAGVAGPLRAIVQAGIDSGDLRVPDAAAAVDTMIGGAVLAIIGAAGRGRDPSAETFRADIVGQLILGVVGRPES